MSKEHEVNEAAPQKSFSYSELAEIVAQAVAQAQVQIANTLAAQGDKNAEVLAAALRESRIPYQDPKQLENEENMRKGMRDAERNKRLNKRAEQAACPHVMGSSPNSAKSLPDSSFAIHVLDNQETIGICTNCQKIISSRRPEDLKWFRAKGGNVASAAGHREFFDPIKARNSRQMTDDEVAPEKDLVAVNGGN